MSKQLWRRPKDAPIDEPVLVWIPGRRLSPTLMTRGRFEVAAVRTQDARSGRILTVFAGNARWTNLPRPPGRDPMEGNNPLPAPGARPGPPSRRRSG